MAISNTTIKVVTVEVKEFSWKFLKQKQIDGDLPENINPKQKLEVGEFAEVILIPVDQIAEKCQEFEKQGCGIDGKIWFLSYAFKFVKFTQNNVANY